MSAVGSKGECSTVVFLSIEPNGLQGVINLWDQRADKELPPGKRGAFKERLRAIYGVSSDTTERLAEIQRGFNPHHAKLTAKEVDALVQHTFDVFKQEKSSSLKGLKDEIAAKKPAALKKVPPGCEEGDSFLTCVKKVMMDERMLEAGAQGY